MKTKIAQGVVAGVLANLSGALIVTVLGTGTIALMLHAAWLRTLFDHGQHLNAVVLYSHELDASNNAPTYLVMCLGFPFIAMFMSMLAAGHVWGSASAADQGGPPRGGGPGQPGPAPGQPGSGRQAEAGSGVGKLAASPVPSPRQRGRRGLGEGQAGGRGGRGRYDPNALRTAWSSGARPARARSPGPGGGSLPAAVPESAVI